MNKSRFTSKKRLQKSQLSHQVHVFLLGPLAENQPIETYFWCFSKKIMVVPAPFTSPFSRNVVHRDVKGDNYLMDRKDGGPINPGKKGSFPMRHGTTGHHGLFFPMGWMTINIYKPSINQVLMAVLMPIGDTKNLFLLLRTWIEGRVPGSVEVAENTHGMFIKMPPGFDAWTPNRLRLSSVWEANCKFLRSKNLISNLSYLYIGTNMNVYIYIHI